MVGKNLKFNIISHSYSLNISLGHYHFGARSLADNLLGNANHLLKSGVVKYPAALSLTFIH